jgi:peroxin-10
MHRQTIKIIQMFSVFCCRKFLILKQVFFAFSKYMSNSRTANLSQTAAIAGGGRPMYPRAPVSLLLRTWDRNSNEVDNLENRISSVARDWFGGAFPAMHDRKIQFAAEFIYFAVTLLMGKTTLGEEQSGLALVQPVFTKSVVNPGVTRTFFLPPSRIRLIVNFAAHLVVPHILRRLWEYFFPEQDSSDGVRRVLLVHVAWWWLWSSSTDVKNWVPESVSSRISGLTAVSTDMKLYGAAAQSSEQYTFLGGLTLLRVAVEAFLWGREKWRNRQVNTSPQAVGTSTETTTNTNNHTTTASQLQQQPSVPPQQRQQQQPANTGTCPLCLETRVNPTSAQCGHVYCWNCLSELLESGSGGVEPRCPLCREVVKPQSFVLLQNFAIPRSS